MITITIRLRGPRFKPRQGRNLKQDVCFLRTPCSASGRPRGTGGTGPPNLRWGTAHASVSPNILRSNVVGCARKYEQSKKDVIKEFCSKKWSSEILVVKMESFHFSRKNVIQKSWFAKIFLVPPKLGARSPPLG